MKVQEIYTKEKGRYTFRKVAESDNAEEAEKEAVALFPEQEIKIVESDIYQVEEREAKQRAVEEIVIHGPLLFAVIVFFPLALLAFLVWLALGIFRGMNPPKKPMY